MKPGNLNLHWSPQCWNKLVSLTEPAHTPEKAWGAGSSSVRTNSGGRTAAAGVTYCWKTKSGTWLCFFIALHSVCVVDGAFLSSSEVTRLGFFWHQVSVMKSAGATLPGSGVRAAGLCAQLTAGTAKQWGSAAASSSDPGSEQVDRVYIYPFPYCWLYFQSQVHQPLPNAEVPTTVLLKCQCFWTALSGPDQSRNSYSLVHLAENLLIWWHNL